MPVNLVEAAGQVRHPPSITVESFRDEDLGEVGVGERRPGRPQLAENGDAGRCCTNAGAFEKCADDSHFLRLVASDPLTHETIIPLPDLHHRHRKIRAPASPPAVRLHPRFL